MKELILGYLKELGESAADDPLAEDEDAYGELTFYMNGLSRPRIKSAPIPQNAGKWFDHSYGLDENEISLLPGVYSSALEKFVLCTTAAGPVGVERLALKNFTGNDFVLELQVKGVTYGTPVGVDGLYRIGHFNVPEHPELPSEILAYGYWEEGTLYITLNYIETCYFNQIQVNKTETGAVITFLESYMFDEDGYRTVFEVEDGA